MDYIVIQTLVEISSNTRTRTHTNKCAHIHNDIIFTYINSHETKTVAISTNHPMIMRNFHIHVWILFTEIKRKRFAQFALSFTPNQMKY